MRKFSFFSRFSWIVCTEMCIFAVVTIVLCAMLGGTIIRYCSCENEKLINNYNQHYEENHFGSNVAVGSCCK